MCNVGLLNWERIQTNALEEIFCELYPTPIFKPAYEVVVDAIREVDDVGIVLYEPTFHGQAWHGDWLGSGFTEVPGGPEYKNRSAFSFHMYCWTMEFIAPNVSDEEK